MKVLEQSAEVFGCNEGIQNFDWIQSVTAKEQKVPLTKITIADNNFHFSVWWLEICDYMYNSFKILKDQIHFRLLPYYHYYYHTTITITITITIPYFATQAVVRRWL